MIVTKLNQEKDNEKLHIRITCNNNEYSSMDCNNAYMERVMGIEPTQPAWKAGTLPLSYTRFVRKQ